MERNVTRLNYDAKVGAIFGIWITDIILSILTLGIYSFWGRSRLRKYLIGSFSLLGDRFEYTGTGKELFNGLLRLSLILLLFYAPFYFYMIYIPEVDKKSLPIWFYLAFLAFFASTLALVHLGTFLSMRYRLSRITWRGIRGRLTGSALSFLGLTLWRAILNILTLGILIPYSDLEIQGYMLNHTYFGSVKVQFNCSPSRLMLTHVITGLLFIPTLGFSRFWYRAALARHINDSITINNLKLQGTQTGGSMCMLFIGNALIMIFTIGLGRSLVIHRKMKYFAENTILIGDINTSNITQSTERLGKSGEGIETLLGEGDFGLGA